MVGSGRILQKGKAYKATDRIEKRNSCWTYSGKGCFQKQRKQRLSLQKGHPTMVTKDFKERIEELKKKKDAFIIAHYYQRHEIQEVADFIGDSLELSKKAAQIKNNLIVFCGVYFMAELAKILAPHKKVLIPYKKAGCLLADMAEVRELREKKKELYQF